MATGMKAMKLGRPKARIPTQVYLLRRNFGTWIVNRSGSSERNLDMKKNQAYPSSYLAQDDVREAPIRATIQDVRIETIGGGDRAEEKPVMHFREEKLKSFVLNQTNWATIEEAYGEESDAWVGKPIELYLDPGVKFGRETVGGVRVRVPAAAGGSVLSMETALAQALKAGKTRDEFVAALKAKGLKGYSPTKDSAVARTILAEWAGAEEPSVEDTIPF